MFPRKAATDFCLLFGLMCSFALSVSAQFLQAIDLDSDPNLVLRYEFEGLDTNATITDLSGHGNDGIQFNTTNLLVSTNGIFGTQTGKFQYVGTFQDGAATYNYSQYVAVTNLNGFAYLTNATFSVWARFDSNTDSGMYILDCGYNNLYAPASVASNSFTLGRNFHSFLSFMTYPATGGVITVVNWPNDVVRSGGSTPDYSTTNFHLYSLTIDCPNNRAVAYYDGNVYMTNTVGVSFLRVYGSPTLPWLCVGAMTHNGSPQWGDDDYPNAAFFCGRMDDLRIYNRTLSSGEITALYLRADAPIQAQNVSASRTANSIRVAWTGQSNYVYQVESRTNLFSGAWSGISARILSSGGVDAVTNAIANGQTNRFFRVRPLP